MEEKADDDRTRVFTVRIQSFPTPASPTAACRRKTEGDTSGRKRRNPSRNFLFCVDVSAAMSASRLELCQIGLVKLVNDYCRDSGTSVYLLGRDVRSGEKKKRERECKRKLI